MAPNLISTEHSNNVEKSELNAVFLAAQSVKKIGENKGNARSDSGESDDEELANKRKFSRSFGR